MLTSNAPAWSQPASASARCRVRPSGFAAHAATRGQRDFSSVSRLAAGRYDLIAREGQADQARTMPGQAGLLPG